MPARTIHAPALLAAVNTELLDAFARALALVEAERDRLSDLVERLLEARANSKDDARESPFKAALTNVSRKLSIGLRPMIDLCRPDISRFIAECSASLSGAKGGGRAGSKLGPFSLGSMLNQQISRVLTKNVLCAR